MRFAIQNFFERLIAKGEGVCCPCCERSAKRFFPAGVANKRPFARCVWCGSLERHRLIALILQESPLPSGARVLSIAPETPLTTLLKKRFQANITTVDLLRTDVDVQADVCHLPFADQTFDLVIANHVLEHVPDDTQAMRELARVTKLNGRAILQTPVRWDQPTTDEDPDTEASERLRRFGQTDHVRQYGADIVERFKQNGWHTQLRPVTETFSPEEMARYGLEHWEVFLELKK